MTDHSTYEALLAEVKRLQAENAELKSGLAFPTHLQSDNSVVLKG